MGQPNPPGDIPLYEGLGTEWNDIVSGFPEDKRAELAPLLKARVDQFAPLKEYEDFHKNGINKQQVETALNLFGIIENNPRQVYDQIGKYLGITPAEAKAAVAEVQAGGEEGNEEDSRISTLENQLNTLIQIRLAERDQSTQAQLVAQQEQLLDKQLGDLKAKFGDDVNEEEVIMRMLHKDMTAEAAHEEYSKMANSLRMRRPSPMLIGNGGVVPRQAINPAKLSGKDTRNLVAQMMQQASDEGKQ